MTDMDMAAQLIECMDRDVTALRTLYQDLNAQYEQQDEWDTPQGEQARFLLDQAGRLATRLASLG